MKIILVINELKEIGNLSIESIANLYELNLKKLVDVTNYLPPAGTRQDSAFFLNDVHNSFDTYDFFELFSRNYLLTLLELRNSKEFNHIKIIRPKDFFLEGSIFVDVKNIASILDRTKPVYDITFASPPEKIINFFYLLNEEEKDIVGRYYLNCSGQKKLTLTELATIYGTSTARICKILKRALRKLRRPWIEEKVYSAPNDHCPKIDAISQCLGD